VSRDPTWQRFFVRANEKSRPHFDLAGFALQRLKDAGLKTVTGLSTCTYESESLFFSYRRKTKLHEPDYGRQISAIVVA
jgi:copper oxidase (laccase) domain-containing protein